MYVAVLGKQLD